MIRIVGKRGKGSFESQLDDAAKGKEFVVVDCTSGNKDMEIVRGLSPFYLGPVETYDGLVSSQQRAHKEEDKYTYAPQHSRVF